MSDPSERLQHLIHQELCRAVSARIEAGADPREISADLGLRVRRLRRMRQEAQLHYSVPTPDPQ